MTEETTARPGLREPLLAYLAATAIAAALYWAGRVVAFVGENLHAGIAITFLGMPALASRLSGRPFDYTAAGLRLDPVRLNLRVLGGAIAITWPLFCVGFLIYYEAVCGALRSPIWGVIVDWMTPQCVRWQGLRGASVHWPPDFLLSVLTQILVVAVPEELFFRGYLQARLDQRLAPRWRLAGVPLGWGWLLAAALFALGHVLVDLNPERIAVFVPGLVFGWMWARTGSIAAGVLFHAACNVLSDVLHRSFFF